MSKLTQWIANVRGEPRADPIARPEIGAPHDDINDAFHDAYEQTKHEAHEEVPVLVVLGDQLVMFRRGERTAYDVTPRSFHLIKSVAHAPLGIFAMLRGERGDDVSSRLRELRKRLEQALSTLPVDAADLSEEARADLRHVIEKCIAFADAPSRSALEPFAQALGPTLLRLTDAATELQLNELHGETERVFSRLDDGERDHVQVVVAGDHQARARSLAMQYFQKRLDEPADREKRVTFAEAVTDEQAAVALVGTRRLDHAMGSAFFGDGERLQRDILGDAAAKQLANRSDIGPR